MDEKMVTKNGLIASGIIPLLGINLAFLGLCVVAVINIWQNESLAPEGKEVGETKETTAPWISERSVGSVFP